MTTLQIFICFLAICFWGGMIGVFFRTPITAWFHNRFGRDKPLLPPEGEMPEPFSFKRREDDQKKS
ncbi:hypothetical protein [Brytella acorum]|uniref:Uncharacterized protein n=1 Tax=Brytella acorum TaxID=2959299 RepID=A0AA35UXB4_9PROT|nr:hypothetical protein [Brytella acorum]MDF3624227.1 hypothetical protein [Brytella acorum]CAI9121199.1 hypothetical protein LMG32879_002045 [Brytella acorum]